MSICDCFFCCLTDAAGSNSAHAGPSNAVKLDNETEELKHNKLDLSVGKVIQQARTAKGLTQVELARVCSTLIDFLIFFK